MDVRNMTRRELSEYIAEHLSGPGEEEARDAKAERDRYYGNRIFIRGLIEFTNYCKNDCLYCGIRKSNKCASRYRLSKDEILGCVLQGRELGMNTFVLQGGEDMYYSDKQMCDIISAIKETAPGCAVTLSIGERSRESYKAYKDAGADRFLLRHETADEAHYSRLHPKSMSLKNRMKCLYTLKELGYQAGAGFMVGSPYQTPDTLAEDIIFLRELEPHMVGIGPFIAHKDTPFRDMPNGTVGLTLTMLTLTRLALPRVLLPATTALATLDDMGREKAFNVGANVVMPNLSPPDSRNKYSLYDNKANSGDEAAEGLRHLSERIENAGYVVDMGRGDSKMNIENNGGNK